MRLIINQGHSVPVGGIWKNQGEEFEGNPDDYPKGAVSPVTGGNKPINEKTTNEKSKE